MHEVSRWLLIGLLIVVLPLKGLATTGYLGCSLLHHQRAGAVQVNATQQAGRHHHETHFRAPNDAPAPVAESLQDAATFADQQPQEEASKCTQCAPCCGATAPPAEAMQQPSAAGPTELKVAVNVLELGGDHHRLDRPPRRCLV